MSASTVRAILFFPTIEVPKIRSHAQAILAEHHKTKQQLQQHLSIHLVLFKRKPKRVATNYVAGYAAPFDLQSQGDPKQSETVVLLTYCTIAYSKSPKLSKRWPTIPKHGFSRQD